MGWWNLTSPQAMRLLARSQPPVVLPAMPPVIRCCIYCQFTLENFNPTCSVRISPSLMSDVTWQTSTFSRLISKYLIRSPSPSARMNSSRALAMVLPVEQLCMRMGEARSASLIKLISECSQRSAVWPPPVEAVQLWGCERPQCTSVHSIQLRCLSSRDSPLMPSICRYTSIATFPPGTQ